MNKLLVTTGMPISDGIKSEVIHLGNPSSTCSHLEDFPESISGGMGTLIDGEKIPFICGGYSWTDSDESDRCYKLGQSLPSVSLTTPRNLAASVLLDHLEEPILWIAGGINEKGLHLSSTEYVTQYASVQGPDLPHQEDNCLLHLPATHC